MERSRFPQYVEKYGDIFQNIPYGEEYDKYVAMIVELDGSVLKKYDLLLRNHLEDLYTFALMNRNVHLRRCSVIDMTFFVNNISKIVGYKSKIFSSNATSVEKIVKCYCDYGILFQLFCKKIIGIDLTPVKKNSISHFNIEDFSSIKTESYDRIFGINALNEQQCHILLSHIDEITNTTINTECLFSITPFSIYNSIELFIQNIFLPYHYSLNWEMERRFINYLINNSEIKLHDILSKEEIEEGRILYNHCNENSNPSCFEEFLDIITGAGKWKTSGRRIINNNMKDKFSIFIKRISNLILDGKLNFWSYFFLNQESLYNLFISYFKHRYIEYRRNQLYDCLRFDFFSPYSSKWRTPDVLIRYLEKYEKNERIQIGEHLDRENEYIVRQWANQIKVFAQKREEEEAKKRHEEYERQMEPFRYNIRNRHWRDRNVSFREADHVYIVDGTPLDSVTTFVKNCFPEFDSEFHAKRKAEALGITKEAVLEMWDKKGRESREQGTVMHKKIESFYLGKEPSTDETFELFKIFADKIALKPYRTEWAVYDWEQKIAGTIDFVDYQNGEYIIYDWKRSDKLIAKNGLPIKNSLYGEKALPPIENLDDSPYYHYALQLSLYKYILEKNYGITVSKLRLGIFHPSYNKPYVLEMPYLQNEIDTLFGLRSEVIF